MKSILTTVAVVLLTCITGIFYCKAQSGIGIPYPKPLPDAKALVFLPGLVSRDSLDFGSAFSPDGQSFYFTRSANKQTKIYVTHYKGSSWAEPEPLTFTAGKYSEADPVFAPDGSFYFISNRPAHAADTLADFDIWALRPLPGGRWSAPENVRQLNTDSSEYYISFSKNGNLYFASSRTGGFGMEDLYVSRLEQGKHTKPENLGPAVNTAKSEYDPGITSGEDMIIFASSGRDDSFGAADLYGARLNAQKKWQPAVHLGKALNTGAREFCPYFSPDGKYFFFSSERDIKWIDIKSLAAAL
jgi:hypothetical protein